MTEVLSTDTVRISASSAVSYTLLFGLVGSMATGIWYARGEVAALDSIERGGKADIAALAARTDAADKELNARLDRVVAAFDPRIKAVEQRDDARSAAVAAMDSRLARIEAQLDIMLRNFAKQDAPGGHK